MTVAWLLRGVGRARALGLASVLALAGGPAWTARASDPDEDPAKIAKGLEVFKQHVRPVFVKQCLKCHGGKAVEGDLDMTDRDRLLKGGEAGPAVVPGDARKSLLYLLITHRKEPYMPQEARKLSDEVIARVAEWIDLGAPYDEPLEMPEE